MCKYLVNYYNYYCYYSSEIRRAETATQRIHRWRIVKRPLDIEVSCEISGIFPTNKQSRTNSGLSTRVQKVCGWHRHPH